MAGLDNEATGALIRLQTGCGDFTDTINDPSVAVSTSVLTKARRIMSFSVLHVAYVLIKARTCHSVACITP